MSACLPLLGSPRTYVEPPSLDFGLRGAGVVNTGTRTPGDLVTKSRSCELGLQDAFRESFGGFTPTYQGFALTQHSGNGGIL